MSWLNAIKKVLSDSGEAMHYKDITEEIISKQLIKTKIGATPSATVSSYLTTNIDTFQRVERGKYILKEAFEFNKNNLTKNKDEKDSIITSFGMFWSRDFITWKNKPSLLGRENAKSDIIDFKEQIGVYLLYDGREIIYVGRSTDQSIAQRLNKHTTDRLSSRWDRFSWFGLLPIDKNGKLIKALKNYNLGFVISTLEAILIEALEPCKNRQGGKGFSSIEYIQKEDPKIEMKRKMKSIENYMQELMKETKQEIL